MSAAPGPTAWELVGAGGLDLPEPPPHLAASVRALGDTLWGTREPGARLRRPGAYASEYLEDRHPGDFVLAGLDEVATGLVAVHYYLVCGRFAMFVQTRADDPRGAETLVEADRLQRLAIPLIEHGLPGDGRLVVAHSFVGTKRWQWSGEVSDGGLEGISGAAAWVGQQMLG